MTRANFRYLAVGRPAAERHVQSAPRRRKASAKSAARPPRELVH
jgi:hypothetical protein